MRLAAYDRLSKYAAAGLLHKWRPIDNFLPKREGGVSLIPMRDRDFDDVDCHDDPRFLNVLRRRAVPRATFGPNPAGAFRRLLRGRAPQKIKMAPGRL